MVFDMAASLRCFSTFITTGTDHYPLKLFTDRINMRLTLSGLNLPSWICGNKKRTDIMYDHPCALKHKYRTKIIF